MSLQHNSISEGLHQNDKVMPLTGKCTQVGMFENGHSTCENVKYCNAATKSDGSPTSERRAMMQE